MGRAYDGFQKQIYSKEQEMNITKLENAGQGRESQRRNEASLSEEKLYNVRCGQKDGGVVRTRTC